MRVVIVTGDGPEHRYVANALLEQFEIEAVLVCDPARRRSWTTVLRRSPSRFVDKLLRKVFLTAIRDAAARRSSLSRVLGRTSRAFARPDLVRSVGRPKAGSLAAAVAELRPDVLAIYGTSIIPDDVLGVPRVVALNMHTGLSPDYRGVGCAYWPIVEGRPDMVGATVHECTSDVDGGKIFFRERAELERGDDLHAIFGRAVMVGAQGYVKVVGEAMAGDLEGVPQDLTRGREFPGSRMGLRSEVAARMSLRRLRRAGSP